MKHELSDFVDKTFQDEFQSGHLKSGYDAALFCLQNGVPIPKWLTGLVEPAIRYDFERASGRGKGKPAPRKASRRFELARFIQSEVARRTDLGLTQRDAFEVVAQDLQRSANDGKFWTGEAVKKIYFTTNQSN